MAPTTVLISGANRGIGKGLVERYLARDDHTVVATVRDPNGEYNSLPWTIARPVCLDCSKVYHHRLRSRQLTCTRLNIEGPRRPADRPTQPAGSSEDRLDRRDGRAQGHRRGSSPGDQPPGPRHRQRGRGQRLPQGVGGQGRGTARSPRPQSVRRDLAVPGHAAAAAGFGSGEMGHDGLDRGVDGGKTVYPLFV